MDKKYDTFKLPIQFLEGPTEISIHPVKTKIVKMSTIRLVLTASSVVAGWVKKKEGVEE